TACSTATAPATRASVTPTLPEALPSTPQPTSSPLTLPTPTATSRAEPLGPAPAANVNRLDVDLGDNFFSPNSVTVHMGTTVIWHNRGGGENQHNVEAQDSSFRSGDINPGNTFAHTFGAPGRYPYVCSYHVPQGMTGEVIVE